VFFTKLKVLYFTIILLAKKNNITVKYINSQNRHEFKKKILYGAL